MADEKITPTGKPRASDKMPPDASIRGNIARQHNSPELGHIMDEHARDSKKGRDTVHPPKEKK